MQFDVQFRGVRLRVTPMWLAVLVGMYLFTGVCAYLEGDSRIQAIAQARHDKEKGSWLAYVERLRRWRDQEQDEGLRKFWAGQVEHWEGNIARDLFPRGRGSIAWRFPVLPFVCLQGDDISIGPTFGHGSISLSVLPWIWGYRIPLLMTWIS